MYCKNCGSIVDDDAKFCSACGTKLRLDEEPEDQNKGSSQDPYKILGVSRDASDEEIKKAYREQMKKYHPDNFSQFNVPEMDELANEKARELKDAYEAIINGYASQGGTDGVNDELDAKLIKINEELNQGQCKMALLEIEELIAQTPLKERNDKLCITAANVYYKSGPFSTAIEYMDEAIERKPCAEYCMSAASMVTDYVLAERNEIKKLVEACHKTIKCGQLPKPADIAKNCSDDGWKWYRNILDDYSENLNKAQNFLDRALNIERDSDNNDKKSVIYGMKAYLNYLMLFETRQERNERADALGENMSKAGDFGDSGGYIEKIREAGNNNL